MKHAAPLLTLALVLAACGSGPREKAPASGDGAPAETTAQAGSLTLPFLADDYAGALNQARERKLPIFIETWAPW
jgi:hypothetical protein